MKEAMKFTITRDEGRHLVDGPIIRFRGEVSMRDVEALDLDPVEQAMLESPSKEPEAHRLVLAMLYLRWRARQRAEDGTP